MINARILPRFQPRVLLYAGTAAIIGITSTTGARLIQIEQSAQGVVNLSTYRR